MNKFRKLIAGALLLALCLSLFAACAPAAEFTFATDLEDGRVQADAAYSFRLSILYGDEPVTPEVTCNGILLTAAENHTYTAPLRDGENEIEFSAQQGKDRSGGFPMTDWCLSPIWKMPTPPTPGWISARWRVMERMPAG